MRKWLDITADLRIRFVLADDGCEIDDDTLPYLPSNTQLVVLKAGEDFEDVSKSIIYL